MAVHHIINDYNLALGGAQRLAIDLHKGGLDAGLSSKLFGLSKDPNYTIEGASSLQYKSPYKLIVFVKLWGYFKKEVNSGDVVHVHLFPAIFYVSVLQILKLIPKCKLILTEHNTTNNRRNKLWGKWVDYLSYKSYDRIIAISKGTAEAFLKWQPSIEHKVQIINNGAHLIFDSCIVRKQKPTPIIISVGRLHIQKNYKTALNAISKIKELNFEYWIAGLGDLETKLKEQVNELGLSEKVKFLDYISDIPTLLKKGDIFLIPSRWEGFGLAAVEAMNASLPSVVSDVPGLGDLIKEDGEDAFLVAPSNENIIAQRLTQLIENKELRHEMGKKAFTRSLYFGVDTMIKDYMNLYKKISNG
jgi:glycosyltransferase involved in cell wall biosynthesis